METFLFTIIVCFELKRVMRSLTNQLNFFLKETAEARVWTIIFLPQNKIVLELEIKEKPKLVSHSQGRMTNKKIDEIKK